MTEGGWKRRTHSQMVPVHHQLYSRLLYRGLELNALLEETKLAGVPLLVFANKQDLMNALPSEEVSISSPVVLSMGRCMLRQMTDDFLKIDLDCHWT